MTGPAPLPFVSSPSSARRAGAQGELPPSAEVETPSAGHTIHEVARIIADVIGSPLNLARAAGSIRPEDDLACDLALDSLHRQSLACECDEHFLIEIPDRDITGWRTVADVVRSVERLLSLASTNVRCAAMPGGLG